MLCISNYVDDFQKWGRLKQEGVEMQRWFLFSLERRGYA